MKNIPCQACVPKKHTSLGKRIYIAIVKFYTSSMNKTPGTISALPSSRHSATLLLIWSRTSGFISPVSPIIQ